MPILTMSKMYGKCPSDIVGIKDEYTAYCFNQYCLILLSELEQGHELHFAKKKKEYKSISDFYKSMGV